MSWPDGTPVAWAPARGLVWLETAPTTSPGQRQVLDLDVEDPSGEGRVKTVDQPLVRPEKVSRTPC